MPNAEVIQPTSSKPPTLTAGTLTPEVLREFEEGCLSYFNTKENMEAKDYVKRIGSGLRDHVVSSVGRIHVN